MGLLEVVCKGSATAISRNKMPARLGLTGWVRNRLDGRVELLAEGQKEQLDNLIAWLHQGPPSSRVDAVDVEWGEATEEFEKFKIRSTS